MKEKYLKPETDIINFKTEDVIVTSGEIETTNDETPIM